MKIIKIPKWSIVKCSCGAEFEIEKDDISIETYNMGNLDGTRKIIFTWYINCPFCGEQHNLKMGE
ncbi:hypothetical protein IJE86_07935 [bacterium]|nr:hypothetical protein [bacterium]